MVDRLSDARPGVNLTVVMPALDESDGIVRSLELATASLRSLHQEGIVDRYEFIVVDDGSGDATASLVQALAEESPHIRLLQHPRNQGVGAALRTGIDAAAGDVLLYTDADTPVDLENLREALPHLEDPRVGMVIGRRQGFGAEPAFRRLASVAYDRLARVVFKTPHADVNFPFKLLRTTTARDLVLRSNGALVDVELIARVGGLGLRIVSLEMAYQPRQAGRSKTMRVRLLGTLALEMARHLFSIRSERTP